MVPCQDIPDHLAVDIQLRTQGLAIVVRQTLSFDNKDPVVQHQWLELSCDQRIQGFFLIRGRKEQKKIMLVSLR